MLFFTRWKAAAIVLTALVVCLFAVPNFFPESVVQRLPSWAQRHIVLGLDLQGGSSLLLQVDTNSVRKERLQALDEDVLRVLREARIPFTGRAVRGDHVEVHITRPTDVDNALSKLQALSQPMSGFIGTTGQRDVDVSQNSGLITLTPTEPAITERIRQAVDQSIEIIQRRVNELGLVEPSIQREGADRILVQVPGLQDPTRLKEILGKTAKLDFRMVDLSMTPEQAAATHPPEDFGNSRRPELQARNISSKSACWFPAAISSTPRPASISRPASRSSTSASIPRARRNSQPPPRPMSASRSPSCSTTR